MIPLPQPPESPNIRALAQYLSTHTSSGGGVVTWSSITGTPTTVGGYGITDALTAGGNLTGTWNSYSNNLSAGPFAAQPDTLVGLSGTTLQRYTQAALSAFLANATIPGNWTASDIRAMRVGAITTGVIYLGSGSNSYVSFDGTQYLFGGNGSTADVHATGVMYANDFVLN